MLGDFACNSRVPDAARAIIGWCDEPGCSNPEPCHGFRHGPKHLKHEGHLHDLGVHRVLAVNAELVGLVGYDGGLAA